MSTSMAAASENYHVITSLRGNMLFSLQCRCSMFSSQSNIESSEYIPVQLGPKARLPKPDLARACGLSGRTRPRRFNPGPPAQSPGVPKFPEVPISIMNFGTFRVS
eukprot:762583-Hanusia_phi.AAC.4